jgi:hypothetical protein
VIANIRPNLWFGEEGNYGQQIICGGGLHFDSDRHGRSTDGASRSMS